MGLIIKNLVSDYLSSTLFKPKKDNQDEKDIWRIPEPIPKQFSALEGHENRTLCERR